jgi:hypothetical protein
MTSFELDLIDEKTRAGAEFLMRVVDEMRRALVAEKSERKLTQQSIADKIGTSRHVINRELQGLENISARRIGEFFWAIGWEPHFEARRVPDRYNDIMRPAATAPREADSDNREACVSALDEKRDKRDKKASAAEVAYAQ